MCQWALLNFLVPSLFGSSEDFAEWFNVEDPTQRGEIVARLHRLLRPFLLRRLKSEVEKALLPKIETKLFVGMSAMQRAWYKKILERDIEVLNATNTSKVRLLNIVMQLRKVRIQHNEGQADVIGRPDASPSRVLTRCLCCVA